jgi:hypothetical protein
MAVGAGGRKGYFAGKIARNTGLKLKIHYAFSWQIADQ